MDSGRLRRAQQRCQILRILNLIEDEQQRFRARRFSPRQDFFERRERILARMHGHALMVSAQLVQRRRGNLFHTDVFSCEPG